MTPQEAIQLRAHLERVRITAANKYEDPETESDGESETSSDYDDDE
jgi:hypothetical protein